jgi:hypothetical protein
MKADLRHLFQSQVSCQFFAQESGGFAKTCQQILSIHLAA